MIRGIVPALITPMNQDGTAVDLPAVRDLVEFLLARGVSGFFVCGGTGEGLLLTREERRTILEAVVEQTAERASVIAHIGALATQEAQALAPTPPNSASMQSQPCRLSTSKSTMLPSASTTG